MQQASPKTARANISSPYSQIASQTGFKERSPNTQNHKRREILEQNLMFSGAIASKDSFNQRKESIKMPNPSQMPAINQKQIEYLFQKKKELLSPQLKLSSQASSGPQSPRPSIPQRKAFETQTAAERVQTARELYYLLEKEPIFQSRSRLKPVTSESMFRTADHQFKFESTDSQVLSKLKLQQTQRLSIQTFDKIEESPSMLPLKLLPSYQVSPKMSQANLRSSASLGRLSKLTSMQGFYTQRGQRVKIPENQVDVFVAEGPSSQNLQTLDQHKFDVQREFTNNLLANHSYKNIWRDNTIDQATRATILAKVKEQRDFEEQQKKDQRSRQRSLKAQRIKSLMNQLNIKQQEIARTVKFEHLPFNQIESELRYLCKVKNYVKSIVKIQAFARMIVYRARFRRVKSYYNQQVKYLQGFFRARYLYRASHTKFMDKRIKAAIVIQRYMRGILTRRRNLIERKRIEKFQKNLQFLSDLNDRERPSILREQRQREEMERKRQRELKLQEAEEKRQQELQELERQRSLKKRETQSSSRSPNISRQKSTATSRANKMNNRLSVIQSFRKNKHEIHSMYVQSTDQQTGSPDQIEEEKLNGEGEINQDNQTQDKSGFTQEDESRLRTFEEDQLTCEDAGDAPSRVASKLFEKIQDFPIIVVTQIEKDADSKITLPITQKQQNKNTLLKLERLDDSFDQTPAFHDNPSFSASPATHQKVDSTIRNAEENRDEQFNKLQRQQQELTNGSPSQRERSLSSASSKKQKLSKFSRSMKNLLEQPLESNPANNDKIQGEQDSHSFEENQKRENHEAHDQESSITFNESSGESGSKKKSMSSFNAKQQQRKKFNETDRQGKKMKHAHSLHFGSQSSHSQSPQNMLVLKQIMSEKLQARQSTRIDIQDLQATSRNIQTQTSFKKLNSIKENHSRASQEVQCEIIPSKYNYLSTSSNTKIEKIDSQMVKSIDKTQVSRKIRKEKLRTMLVYDKLVSCSSQYQDDPYRFKCHIVHQLEPFISETPGDLIAETFYTPNNLFFVHNHGPVPILHEEDFCVYVMGQVHRQLRLSLQDLKSKFTQVTLSTTLKCAANRKKEFDSVQFIEQGLNPNSKYGVGGIGTAVWTGYRLRDILKYAQIDLQNAKMIEFFGEDMVHNEERRYSNALPVDVCMDKSAEIILAYEMNGEPLSPDHGFPLRLICPGMIGAKSVKWLSRILVLDTDTPSQFYQRDYKFFPSNFNSQSVASQWANFSPLIYLNLDCFCINLLHNDVVPSDKRFVIKGIAIAGNGMPISRVEISFDDGQSWTICKINTQTPKSNILNKESSKSAALFSSLRRKWDWTPWEYALNDGLKEESVVKVRAFDACFNSQPEDIKNLWNFKGYMNNSIQRLKIYPLKK